MVTLIRSGVSAKPDISQSTLSDYFSMKFTGYLSIPTSGMYVFALFSDDGSKLWIDGRLIVDHDGAHGGYKKYGWPVNLSAGNHTIRVEYFEGAGNSEELGVYWIGPNISSIQEVPASRYSH